MDFATVKALHIIFVVSWFAGLFYVVRLFIYHVEAQDKGKVEKEALVDYYYTSYAFNNYFWNLDDFINSRLLY